MQHIPIMNANARKRENKTLSEESIFVYYICVNTKDNISISTTV